MQNKIEIEIPYKDDELIMIPLPDRARRENGYVIVPFGNWDDAVSWVQRIYYGCKNKTIKVRIMGERLPIWVDSAPAVTVRRKGTKFSTVLLKNLTKNDIQQLVS